MATPPTFIADYEGASWITTATKTTASFNGDTGDVLVALVGDPHDQGDENPTLSNTQGAETWAEGSESTGALTADCWAQAITTTLTANRTGMTVSAAMAVASYFGLVVARFADSDGIGNVVGSGSLTGGPSLSFTTTADNSAIVYLLCDWNAMDGATRTHRTVNGYTPTAGNGQEIVYAYSAANYMVCAAYIPDAGAAGAKTIGMSLPTSQKAVIAAVEVLASTSGGLTVNVTDDAGSTDSFTGPPVRFPLPVSFGATSAWVAPASSATVTPTYPADDNLDLIAAFLAIKPNTATVATPANWTAGPVQAVGSGTQGAGTGACQGLVFTRVSDGSLSGGSQAFTITSGSSPVGHMKAWKYDATGYTSAAWAPITHSFYSITTASTTFGGTGDVNLDLETGDVLGFMSVSRDDQSTTHTITGLTVPGCGVGSTVQSPAGTIVNAQGNDISAAFAYCTITSGTSSGPPSVTVGLNSSESGGGIFYRIRATGVLAATDHVLTPTDTAGSTDFAAHTHGDATSDTAGSTDTSVVSVARGVAATDSAGSTDTSVVAVGRVVTATDTAGSVDYAVRTYADAVVDTAGSTDTASLAVNRALDVDDTTGSTDTAVVSVGRVAVASDDAGSSDTATVAVAQNVELTPTDTAGATDTSLVTVDKANVTVDTAGSTDTATVALDRAVTVVDTAGATDTATLTSGQSVTATDDAGSVDEWDADIIVTLPYDSAGSTDSVVVDLFSGLTVTTTDGAGSADTATLTRSTVLTFTDTAGATDTATAGLGFGVVAVDDAGATDTATFAEADAYTDAAGSTDSAVVAVGRGVTTVDPAGSTDGTAPTRSVNATDDTGSTDTPAYARTLTPTDDTGSHDDPDIQLLGAGFVIWTDNAGTTDADTHTAVYTRPADDDAGTSDTVTITWSRAVAAVDGAGSTDYAAQTRNVTATDTAGATDTAVVALAAVGGVTATDNAGSTDSAARAAVYARLGADGAGTSDTAVVSAGGGQAHSDSAGSADTAVVTVTAAAGAVDDAGSSDDAIIVVTRADHLTPVDDAGSSDGWTRLAVYTITLIDTSGVTDLATVTITGPPPTTLDYAHANGYLFTDTGNGTLTTLTGAGVLSTLTAQGTLMP